MNELQQLVRPNIRALKPYSSARSEFKGEAEIYLDANENPYDTGFNRYPDPLQTGVKAAISKLVDCPADHIFLGNGSDEVIDLLIRIFCEPREDDVITLPPTYGMYRVCAAISDVSVKEVALLPNFEINVQGVLNAADAHSKLLFICSPNNPTGNDMQEEDVRMLLDRFPGIVVIDEAYIDFSGQPGFIGWIDRYPRLVVMRTFSKAWGMAGVRLGMAFANPEIIRLFNKVKPPYNVNQLTQQAILKAIEDRDRKARWVTEILNERKRMEKALQKFSFVHHIYPSAANFLLVRVEDADSVYDWLVKRGIIIRMRSSLKNCEGCLRLTIGQALENDRLLAALTAFENKRAT